MTYNVHNVRQSLFDAQNKQFMIVLPFDVSIHIVVLTYNVHNIRRPLFDAQNTQFMIVSPFDVNIHIVILTYIMHNLKMVTIWHTEYTIYDYHLLT